MLQNKLEFEKNKVSQIQKLRHNQPFINAIFDTIGYTYQYNKEYFEQLEIVDDHFKKFDEDIYVEEIKVRKSSALLKICYKSWKYEVKLPYMVIDDFRTKVIKTVVDDSINLLIPVFVDKVWINDEVKPKVNIWEFEF